MPVIAGVVMVGDWLRPSAIRAAEPEGSPRQSKVQHFHGPVGPDLDVRGLQIAVDDALFVRRFKGLGDLCRDGESLGHREPVLG
jgi:hypothetical protein